MEHSFYEKIIISMISDELDNSGLFKALNYDPERISNYNKHLLSVLEQKAQMHCSNVKINSLKEINVESHDRQHEIDENIQNESSKKFLRHYYNIEECPSFLFSGSLLEDSDYKLLLQIYSEYYDFCLDRSADNIVEQLKSNMDSYMMKIINLIEEVKDEDKIKFLLRR